MSNGELLSIEPQELQFSFELRKQISCSMRLANTTSDHVAYKVKTTNRKKYCVKPRAGIVLPHSNCDVIVTMQAQKEAPPDMQCKDKFLLQSAVIPGENIGITAKDITPEMFNKESGNLVKENILRVSYYPHPQPPSPFQEGSKEGTSPRDSLSENCTANIPETHAVSKGYLESHENSSEVRDLISKLSKEENAATQQNNKLHQELELLRREGNNRRSGIPFIYLVLVGLLGILLGYLMNRT